MARKVAEPIPEALPEAHQEADSEPASFRETLAPDEGNDNATGVSGETEEDVVRLAEAATAEGLNVFVVPQQGVPAGGVGTLYYDVAGGPMGQVIIPPPFFFTYVIGCNLSNSTF